MPEIAEVETVRRTLKKQILNKKIKNVNVIYEKMIESDLNEFKEKLIGKKFIDIDRIGKWLLFDLDDYFLLSHLRMEGKYFLKDSSQNIEKHEHVIITFEDESDLRYHDTRKFGKMNLVKKEFINNVEGIKKQGFEPNSKNLTKEYLYSKIHNKKIVIKTMLLDQTVISGLGNIYADEVLFAAKINPLRTCDTISLEECENIIKGANEIIASAIKCGGTTIKSYTSSLGVTGRFQQYLKVHQRANEKCYNCSSIIKKIKVNGRGTYYCENCQK